MITPHRPTEYSHFHPRKVLRAREVYEGLKGRGSRSNLSFFESTIIGGTVRQPAPPREENPESYYKPISNPMKKRSSIRRGQPLSPSPDTSVFRSSNVPLISRTKHPLPPETNSSILERFVPNGGGLLGSNLRINIQPAQSHVSSEVRSGFESQQLNNNPHSS